MVISYQEYVFGPVYLIYRITPQLARYGKKVGGKVLQTTAGNAKVAERQFAQMTAKPKRLRKVIRQPRLLGN